MRISTGCGRWTEGIGHPEKAAANEAAWPVFAVMMQIQGRVDQRLSSSAGSAGHPEGT